MQSFKVIPHISHLRAICARQRWEKWDMASMSFMDSWPYIDDYLNNEYPYCSEVCAITLGGRAGAQAMWNEWLQPKWRIRQQQFNMWMSKGIISKQCTLFVTNRSVLYVPSPSAVHTLSWVLNGPKVTVKALTEILYCLPGVRLTFWDTRAEFRDSTAVVVLSDVFTKVSPSEDNSLSW